MDWFESRHSSRMPQKVAQTQHLSGKPKKVNESQWKHKKGQRNLVKIQRKVNEIEWKPKKANDINNWFEPLSHDLIRMYVPDSFLRHWSIGIKILEVSFLVVDWSESNYSGSFLSRESIWIKFQKPILSRELIWINCYKAIVSHELSWIKTF